MELKISVDRTELDETLNKAVELNKILEKANSLINELASKEIAVVASFKSLEDLK